MRTSSSFLRALVFLLALYPSLLFSQAPVSDDTFSSADRKANYGDKDYLAVQGPTSTAYIRFDLSRLPQGITGDQVRKATVRLWVSAVAHPGSFDVVRVASSWNEDTLEGDNLPLLGITDVHNVAVSKESKNHYLVVDVTDLVRDWLNNAQMNYGIAIVPVGNISAAFDSKENATNSHDAELDVQLEKIGLTGPQGTQGLTGPVGPAGPAGPKGDTGATGAAGPQGPKGDMGAQGPEGPQGLVGPKGDTGATGAIGPQGAQGSQGLTGPVGPAGPAGPKGDTGATGAVGPQGPKGDMGAQGPAGVAGPEGPQGSVGPKGDTGATGAVGAQGPQGSQGLTGAVGPAGPAGPKGDTGATGAVGPQGPKGDTGAQGPAGPAGPQGPQGSVGPKGDTGATGAVGPAGPQGPAGQQGTVGSQGPAGAQGPAGPQGPQGPASVGSVTQLTWGNSVSAFGQTVFPSHETFSGFKHIKVRLVFRRTTTANNFALHISSDGVHSYNFACQADGNLVMYYNNGSTVTVLYSPNIFTSSVAGYNYVEFELSPFAASSTQMWGQLNSYRMAPNIAGQTFSNMDLSTGTFAVYASIDSSSNLVNAFVETW